MGLFSVIQIELKSQYDLSTVQLDIRLFAKQEWFYVLKAVYEVTIPMKATEQYFPAVLFIMLHKVWLYLLKSVYEILKCDHSNESH